MLEKSEEVAKKPHRKACFCRAVCRLHCNNDTGKCSCSDMSKTSVPRPLKTHHMTCSVPSAPVCFSPVGGEDGDRLSAAIIFLLACDRRCLTDRVHQTVHNLPDRDDRIQWDVGTLPPFLHPNTHTGFFLSCLAFQLHYLPFVR